MSTIHNKDIILLAHGSGGRLSHELIQELFLKYFNDPVLKGLEDASLIENIYVGKLAFSTDSYVVKPIFFPGGDIGKLAICGTINDLSMRGARPLYLSVGFIIEEGLSIRELEQIVASMARVAKETGVRIITGDTKVVEKGAADKLFINTSGIGVVPPGVDISNKNGREGDIILINGTIGDHGMAIISQREGLNFSTSIESDCAPLNGLVEELLKASSNIHILRDPTRGGLGTTLNEISLASGVGVKIYETSIPVREPVRIGCEMLGLDPLYLANEGKLIVVVAMEDSQKVLETLTNHHQGREARIIGTLTSNHSGLVVMHTNLGTQRVVSMPAGELLPRIC